MSRRRRNATERLTMSLVAFIRTAHIEHRFGDSYRITPCGACFGGYVERRGDTRTGSVWVICGVCRGGPAMRRIEGPLAGFPGDHEDGRCWECSRARAPRGFSQRERKAKRLHYLALAGRLV